MSRLGNPLRQTQKRMEYAFYGVGLVFLALGGKVLYMQTMPSASAYALSDKVFERRDELPARRGQILASDGTAMAVTIDEYTISANPRGWNSAEKDKVASLLQKMIGGEATFYRSELDKVENAVGAKNYYVRLALHVDEERAKKLQSLMGPQEGETRDERGARKKFWEPLSLEASPRRHYPLGNFAPQLIGFTTNSGKGVDGAEKALEKTLSGTSGMRDSLVDARGRAVPGTVNTWSEPVDGNSVVTTIDPKIQAAADSTMREVVEKYKPNFCVAVVMKPTTGEIVAVSTGPTFDLNKKPKNIVDLATNRAFSYNYEPGSTWKVVTASAAIENIPDWQNKHFFITGTASVGKHTIHDYQFWSGHLKPESKGLSEGIRDSSNVTMFEFAQLMPRHILLDYAKRFGIGEKPDLPGFNIAGGYLPKNNPKEWSLAQYANFSFGQGMMITPLQLAQIGSVVANKGTMMKPMLIKEIRDARGKTLKTYQPEVKSANVIRPETAREVTKMLRRVVAEGTARKYIFIPGYPAVGKTGSAQKAIGKRGYSAGKFISSFLGFLPMNKPQYVIAVMADEPHGSHWGSEVCGPAFTQIAGEAMVAMRLENGANAPKPDLNLMERPEPPKK
ncbi:cell division protein FtsI [Abditibacterium utsteinense]|uniref:Cell division protein FtsI n=1 Tax=Abditibacterium utsteinense TaxID=1960156 RepID=A0A2S8SQF0_9BACT|nr:penicillin-binding protein 2 [Abditibacterium utsteinense]PQV63023.1 cell division protein FtsI [Abditibacterium utsteinense]